MASSANIFKTSAETAYEIVRDRIVRGEFLPGERLTRRHMAKITGVSIIPVIEALHRLESEGLVVSERYFGTRVIDVDENTIRDRFALRMAIECQVVRILAIRRSESDINHLSFLSKELDATPRSNEREGVFWSRHYNFHLRLAAYSDCPSFVQELTSLNLFDILRRTVINLPQGPKTSVPERHHEKLVMAIATGDPDHAERVMRDHVNYSRLITEDQF